MAVRTQQEKILPITATNLLPSETRFEKLLINCYRTDNKI